MKKFASDMINAQEIAQITGADKKEDLMFNESTSDYNNYFFFETLTQEESDVCTENCEYGWLYDRTRNDCTTNGCLNNSFEETYGYWTGTHALSYDNTMSAWFVDEYGALNSNGIGLGFCGVRPVITVSKSKINPGLAPVIPSDE